MIMTESYKRQIQQGVKSMLEANLAVQPGETVLVMDDSSTDAEIMAG
jgi:hypothetical protein